MATTHEQPTVTRAEPAVPGIDLTAWRIDPARSAVEFEVPGFWGGLIQVRGRFHHYRGTLDLRRTPAIELTIDADSLDTKNARRDKHLRSDDFFAVATHPHVRFVSDSATLEGEQLTVTGTLHAAGASAPVDVVATLREAGPDRLAGPELEIDATAVIDQRRLGMTFTALGMVGTPARLAVRGRLVQAA
jgi:polyisoprenoid-binding protein YceI